LIANNEPLIQTFRVGDSYFFRDQQLRRCGYIILPGNKLTRNLKY